MPHLYVITCINFVLFNDSNLLLVNLYDHTPPICCHNLLFLFCSTMLLYYICIIFVNLYDHAPHFYYMYYFCFAKFIIFAHLYDHAPHV